jgi:hypothetical protein
LLIAECGILKQTFDAHFLNVIICPQNRREEGGGYENSVQRFYERKDK